MKANFSSVQCVVTYHSDSQMASCYDGKGNNSYLAVWKSDVSDIRNRRLTRVW